jgi:hypothetical protein
MEKDSGEKVHCFQKDVFVRVHDFVRGIVFLYNDRVTIYKEVGNEEKKAINRDDCYDGGFVQCGVYLCC